MKELWSLLVSAQENIGGIPSTFLEKKKEEIKQRKVGFRRMYECTFRAWNWDLLVSIATKNWALATKFSELVAKWQLTVFCPTAKDNRSATYLVILYIIQIW